MSKNNAILKKDLKNDVDIKKFLEETKKKGAESNKFWASAKGRLLIVIGTAIAVLLCVLATIGFHRFGFLIYGLLFLICGAIGLFYTFSNKKNNDTEQTIKISKDEIVLMEKSLKKSHLEYQNIAVTDNGIIDLKTFRRIKYGDIVWVYQTEDTENIAPIGIALNVATVLDVGLPVANNDVRTYLVLRTKKDETIYLGDHTTHSNGFINAVRKTYKCSKEFEEFREVLLKKCPDNALYGDSDDNKKEFCRRIGKPMPMDNNIADKEQDDDIDDGL